MYHSGNGSLGFCFHRQTVASVAHRDDGVLQEASGRCVVHKAGQLRVDPVVHATDRFTDLG